MKAQSALLESAIAMLVLSGAGATVLAILYEGSLAPASQPVLAADLVFDLVSMSNLNATASACIKNATSACMGGMIAELNQIYGPLVAGISVDSGTMMRGANACSAQSDYCIPVYASGTARQVCVYTCGG